ncbi:TSUP family transporter, partial [Mycobacterium pseudoshottsii]|uniref:TSUP family transporter n=1 Tax=Mycobacterium pseudoshottsii TaxID=265949 RepID=UPI0027E3754F
MVRVLIPGPHVFRLLIAGFLLPLGIWLCLRRGQNSTTPTGATPFSRRSTVAVAFGAGVIGGIYGIGGGSLLSPILVGRGLPIATVAPATLIATFITSVAGAITYVISAITTAGQHIA